MSDKVCILLLKYFVLRFLQRMCKPVLIFIPGEFQFVTIDMFLCKAITCKWVVHMIIMHVKCLMKILSHKVSAGELYFASVFPRSLSFSSQTQRDLAREAVRKSLVVLKNGANVDKPMLPLPKNGIKNISCWKSCK
ncbi:putative protein isoform X1 [Capsicum annuum]|uniref:uncharacterized protein LOC107870341 isoform X1 n=1 Tax=Capsicum annuum TaxID=4072 RepID=UPI0007BF20AE|nr:uncharacterized protein LOC107870341 isoform X1 [Capsicum annuum]